MFPSVQFLEGMQLKYSSQAADKGVYIIGSCGFDSIPADMGVLYTKDRFKGMYILICTFKKELPHLGWICSGPHVLSAAINDQLIVILASVKTVCMCSPTGTLTAVESFLTVGSGDDVRNYFTIKGYL